MDNIVRVKEWNKLALMDFKTAEYLINMKPVPIEIICYHCQQSAEKYLKGYLVLNGKNPPKIHDLDELCKFCAEFCNDFITIEEQCTDLTAYGVQPRYPMELLIEEKDMNEALESIREIQEFILKIESLSL